jgi:uncharacterized protein YcbK (DUF882 family)
LFRRAVPALMFLLIPGHAWAAARSENQDAGAQHPGVGPSAKTSAKPGKQDKAKKPSRYAPVDLFQINTKESIKLRFYDDKGKPIKGWQRRFDNFMRCHVTGKVFRMDSRLPHMLYQTGRHFEGHVLEVVSGYRHPKVAKNPKSPHKKGLACDFRVAGIANTELRDYLRKTFDHAGVGYYPNSVFVHLDNRKQGKSAFWIDYSGPGEAANYAENPQEELRNGLAERRSKDDAAGQAEGADDMAQAGEAGRSPGARPKAGNGSGRKPIEIKAPRDTFGD